MMQDATRQIGDLGEYVKGLSENEKTVFYRIFDVQTVTGQLVVPESMRGWVESRFGGVCAVQTQRIVKITNLITLEGALFNPLRGARPLDVVSQEDVRAAIERTRGGPFCHPEEMTPEDVFSAEAAKEGAAGRVRGKYCITASNVAKYDGYHGLVIFDEHNPLCITRDRVRDYIATALRWAKAAHNADTDAKYFFLMWNCLWRGGASIVHGHMQMTLGRGMHYARVEHWRRQAMLYRLAHGTSYFDDLYQAHAALGLATQIGKTRVIASLTPVKEKEVLLISPTRWIDNDDFKDAISIVLQTFIGSLGVQSFNLALFQRPIDVAETMRAWDGAPGWEDWDGFPAIVRVVDRGDLHARAADIGCMELYASSVISSDPFSVIASLV
jgi:hypothetical protein